ncbi:MAG: hypothetical protein M1813_006237 [Trichoglossum hirsutum]|nr:MAG: hypothetical protein M1813_006237 [Trichoglossum hirsutum]
MKVSSIRKSVLGLGVLLHTAAALDAVQIWLANSCQGTSHSWVAIDNGDKTICQTISTTLAGGGLSWVPFATDASFHLLYTTASCAANTPAVIVKPGSVRNSPRPLQDCPSIRTRRDILNTIGNPMVGTCLHEESGIAIDKDKGIETANGKTYEFNPLPSETADNSASGAHVCMKGRYEAELSYALRRAKATEDDREVEELAREYDREGEYKIAEVLHRRLLAGKKKTLGKDGIGTVVSVIFLAESLENQGRYKEAEELYRRAVTTTEQMYGPDDSITLENRRSLAGVVEKRKLSDLYDRWKLEPLENILGINRPNSPASRRKHAPILEHRRKPEGSSKTRRQTLDQSVPDLADLVILRGMEQKARGLKEQKKFKEAKETHWHVLEQRKQMLGPDHPDIQRSMYYLATVLQCEGSKAAAERLYWLALAVGERALGPEHLDTLAIMSNLAITTLMLGRHAEAKEIYRQQLERGVKAFGWDHPKTYSAKFNLNSLLDENEEIRVSDRVDIMRNGKATVEIRRK